MSVGRRTLLGAGTLAALAGCGADPVSKPVDRASPTPTPTTPGPIEVEQISYGADPSQFGELSRPEGTPRGIVVVIHGGFWRSQYDLSLGRSLAKSLAREGWAAWNLEYRRVGSSSGGGGGVPSTLDDIAAGIEALAGVDGLDTSRLVTLGHSAGGHLAAWAAARGRYGFPDKVPVTEVIAQAGVLDLRAAYDEGLGDGAVEDFLGHPPGAGDVGVDPRQQLPLDVPLWCVHGRDDQFVPFAQSADYVAAARKAGARADLVAVEGDHFTVIDPLSEAWARTLQILTR